MCQWILGEPREVSFRGYWTFVKQQEPGAAEPQFGKGRRRRRRSQVVLVLMGSGLLIPVATAIFSGGRRAPSRR